MENALDGTTNGPVLDSPAVESAAQLSTWKVDTLPVPEKCLVRPRKDNSFSSKQQIFAIRHTAAAAKLRPRAAHCGKIGSQVTATASVDVQSTPNASQSQTPIPISPPLQDPLAPDSPPEKQVEDKMMIIVLNLLTNHSDVEDVPFNAPTVAHKALPFPEITASEVSNAILGAGKTTPGKDQIPTVILRLAWLHISALVQDLF
ncbi:hypothetical protein K3495_g8206 [Podosphaera aphanis]|nr:hypothetical protein K3495_g8206 [Podosphaera aphanis]